MTDDEAVGLCFLSSSPVIPAAVEEPVRIDPPAPWLPRMTTEEVRLGDRCYRRARTCMPSWVALTHCT